MKEKIIAGLDIGSSNIKVAVASMASSGQLTLLALENCPSGGIDAGIITNFNVASNNIRSVMDRIEREIGRKIRNVSATIGGSGIEGIEAHGMVALSKRPRQIWQRDVENCLKVAGMVKLSQERQIVERIVNDFYINEGDHIEDPVGLYATKLGAHAYVITAEIAKIKNLQKCVEYAGYILDNTVFTASAISESVLKEEDGKGNIVLIDIGSHITTIALFNDKKLKFVKILQKRAEDIDVPDKFLGLLRHIKAYIKKDDISRIIVTGGGALKENVLENVEQSFGVNCKIGRVQLMWCSLSPSDSVMHTASLGLIACEAKRLRACSNLKNPAHRIAKAINNLIESYF